MELSEDMIEKINGLLENGEKNRNKILFSIIDDLDYLRVLELYKQKKDELEIYKETNLSFDKIRQIIKYIDDVNRTIDSKRRQQNTERYRGVYMINQERKTLSQKDKDAIKKELVKYKCLYRQNKLTKSNLQKNLQKLIVKIEALGNTFEDRMFLAEVYAELNMMEKAETILNEEYSDNLGPYNETLYKKIKKEVIEKRNFQYIKKLYEQGKNEEEIIKDAEKQSYRYRKDLNLRFINYVVNCIKMEKKNELINDNSDEIEK